MPVWLQELPWFWIGVVYFGVGLALGVVFAADEAGNNDSDGSEVAKCFGYWLFCWGWAAISLNIIEPLRRRFPPEEESSEEVSSANIT